MHFNIHLFRRLLLSLFDDPLNAVDEELVHLVSSFVGDKFCQRSHDKWKCNCTKQKLVLYTGTQLNAFALEACVNRLD